MMQAAMQVEPPPKQGTEVDVARRGGYKRFRVHKITEHDVHCVPVDGQGNTFCCTRKTWPQWLRLVEDDEPEDEEPEVLSTDEEEPEAAPKPRRRRGAGKDKD